MIGLIMKDLLNLKKHAKIYLVLIIFYFILGIANEDFTMIRSMVAIVAAIIPITALAYDERCNWDRYALTMPLSREIMVVSKYVLGLIFLITAFIITLIFSLLFSNMPLMENLLANLTTLSVGLVLISVIFPILFNFGVEKGRIFMMLILFAPTAIILLLSKSGLNISMAMINEETIETFLLFSPIFALLIFVFSIIISISIYKKKEF